MSKNIDMSQPVYIVRMTRDYDYISQPRTGGRAFHGFQYVYRNGIAQHQLGLRPCWAYPGEMSNQSSGRGYTKTEANAQVRRLVGWYMREEGWSEAEANRRIAAMPL